jgi:hypothetical protein
MRTIDERREDLQDQLEDLEDRVANIKTIYKGQIELLHDEQKRRIRAVEQKIKVLDLAHTQRLKKCEIIKKELEKSIEDLRGRGSENPNSLEAFEQQAEKDIKFRKSVFDILEKNKEQLGKLK